jgi:hypothetical protein
MAKNEEDPKVALARATQLDRPVALSKTETAVLRDALREGEKTVDAVEDALIEFGRWLLAHVFDDDTAAAIDDRTENSVWLELVRRAGGPTLRLSSKVLYVALRIAAYDRRINDDVFRRLDAGRKELLLPLRDEHRMRVAARHVLGAKLSLAATEKYVAALREQQGKPATPRLTAALLLGRVMRLREGLAPGRGKRRLEKLAAQLSKEQRARFASELRGLRDDLQALAAILNIDA